MIVKYVAIGVLATMASAAISAVSAKLRGTAKLDSFGWRQLRPGPYYHFILVSSAAFASFMSWIYFFVGTYRTDVAEQERAMLLLMTGFGLAAVAVWWTGYARKISWRGQTIRVTRFGRVSEFDTDGVLATETSPGCFKLAFADGRKLRISSHLAGTNELIASLGGPFD